MSIFHEMEEEVIFENMIWRCNEDSMRKAKGIYNKFNQIWLNDLIFFIGPRRPLSFKLISSFYTSIYNLGTMNLPSNIFVIYLYTKKLISKNQISFWDETKEKEILSKTIEEYENPIKPNTLEWYAQIDDVQTFVSFSTNHNINLTKTTIICNGWTFWLVDFVCFCGSINILKYFVLNNIKPTTLSVEKSVQGGSEKIVEYLSSYGLSFNSTLHIAIDFHHNSLAKWLYENYTDSTFLFQNCVKSYNTEMLLYFIEECHIVICIFFF